MSIYRVYETALESINRSRSARFDQRRKKIALDRATEYFISDRYSNFKNLRKNGNFFEAMQRIKDDLSTLVVEDDTITVLAGNEIDLPANYRHDLGLEVKIGNIWRNADPITHNEKGVIYDNYHTRPGKEKTTYYQIGRKLKFDTGNENAITQVRLTYLKNPVVAYLNDDVASLIAFGPTALTINTLYTVVSGSIVHNLLTYSEGQQFNSGAITAFTGTGLVALTVDTEIPEHAQIELSDIMAAALSGNVENYTKNQLKERDINAQ